MEHAFKLNFKEITQAKFGLLFLILLFLYLDYNFLKLETISHSFLCLVQCLIYSRVHQCLLNY